MSVVLPAHNEAKNLPQVLAEADRVLRGLTTTYEVIVVDDGSTDGTGAAVEAIARTNPRVRLIVHPVNQGYGAALRSGFNASRCELIMFCDADQQFDLQELPHLVAAIGDVDMVTGFRKSRRDPLYRKMNAWGWSVLVRGLFGIRARDIDCAFKLFRREALQRIRLESTGALINTEIYARMRRAGLRYREMPVSHFSRVNGQATGANPAVIAKAFGELVRLYGKLRSETRLTYDRDA